MQAPQLGLATHENTCDWAFVDTALAFMSFLVCLQPLMLEGCHVHDL